MKLLKLKPKKTPIEVRDLREQFFMVDSAFIRFWAKPLGHCPTMTYLHLCSYTNTEQYCFPSIDVLAKKIGYNKRSIIRALKMLEFYHLIKVDRSPPRANIYWLTDKKYWLNLKKEDNLAKPEDYIPL